MSFFTTSFERLRAAAAPARDRTWLSYLVAFGVFAGALIALMAAVNLAIDPYGIANAPRWPGINADKPTLSSHLRLAKAAAVRRLRPKGVVLGTSRAEAGLDPGHPGWRAEPTYNLALAGTSAYETLRYFQHAHAVAELEQAVLALDFFMFNAYWPNKPDFDESLLAVTADGRPTPSPLLPVALTTALSIDTFVDSLETVRGQGTPHTAHAPDGTIEGRPGFVDIGPDEGQRDAFLDMERLFMTRIWFPLPAAAHSLRAPDKGPSTIEHFRRLLAIAHRDDIDLRILISPAHARLWQALSVVDLWDDWENWKRALVRVNEEAAQAARAQPFPLWDFSGFDRYSTEMLPPPDDRVARMRWFWDASHFRKALGHRILARVFGHAGAEGRAAENFGVRLTSANVESRLAALRAGLHRYRHENAGDAAEILQTAQEAGAIPD